MQKPPLGLKPQYIHDQQRITEIKEATNRYIDSNLPIPKDWIAEYNKLVEFHEETIQHQWKVKLIEKALLITHDSGFVIHIENWENTQWEYYPYVGVSMKNIGTKGLYRYQNIELMGDTDYDEYTLYIHSQYDNKILWKLPPEFGKQLWDMIKKQKRFCTGNED